MSGRIPATTELVLQSATMLNPNVNLHEHTYTVFVCAHTLRKRRATQFIGSEEAEVARNLPHDGGRQSFVETQRAVFLQDGLNHRPHRAGVASQKLKKVKSDVSCK